MSFTATVAREKDTPGFLFITARKKDAVALLLIAIASFLRYGTTVHITILQLPVTLACDNFIVRANSYLIDIDVDPGIIYVMAL